MWVTLLRIGYDFVWAPVDAQSVTMASAPPDRARVPLYTPTGLDHVVV